MNVEWELKRFVRQIRPGLIGARSNANHNLSRLVDELRMAQPETREQLARQLQELMLTRDFITALTETGLSLESGVFSEVFRRLEYKLLPKPVDGNDILSFLSRIFDAQGDAAWLETIDREKFDELLAFLFLPDRTLMENLAPQILMSLEILSLRLAGLGYDPVLTQRLRAKSEYQTAFMDVTRHVYALLDGKGDQELPAIREALDRCAKSMDWIRSRKGVDGVSLALTFRMMRVQQIVHRMRLVLQLTEMILLEWNSKPARELFFEIVLAEIRRFNMRSFIGENIALLAYQITEHTGKTGEHYITRNRREWVHMFRSAALGGAIVGVLAVLKFVISRWHLPMGPEALAFSLLYAIGFLVIHSLGGTLATKQPAMTASTVAASLDGAESSTKALENLSEVIVRTVRSQLVAVLGNYLVAFPVAVVICALFMWIKLPVISVEKAQAVLASLHPFKSMSFWYAAVAGVGLFASGLLAGLVDNWFVFNRVSERLKNSEYLRSWVGTHGLGRAIHTIDHNLGVWVGNASLGFYLGCVPAIGAVFGLPLDVRHITFSSGQFGSAMATLGFQVSWPLLLTIAIGIFCFGLINLGVSFSLTLFVVIRSRKIRFRQTPQLLKLLGQRFRRRPQDFFYPSVAAE